MTPEESDLRCPRMGQSAILAVAEIGDAVHSQTFCSRAGIRIASVTARRFWPTKVFMRKSRFGRRLNSLYPDSFLIADSPRVPEVQNLASTLEAEVCDEAGIIARLCAAAREQGCELVCDGCGSERRPLTAVLRFRIHPPFCLGFCARCFCSLSKLVIGEGAVA